MLKVIIAGSRTFDDYELLKQKCDLFLKQHSDIEIVSGNAKGADKLGELYAKEKRYKIKQFIPDWKQHGKQAGIIRNIDMGDYANALIAFWNGRSRGTKFMIEYAEKKGLQVRVVRF